MVDGDDICGAIFIIILWVGANIADAFWMYYFVLASIWPVPALPVDRTHVGWEAYKYMMYIFGFILGWVNAGVSLLFIASTSEDDDLACLCIPFHLLITVPVGLFLTIMPFFGGWIVPPIVRNHAWHHECDGYPMYAILDAASAKDPPFIINTAYFYEPANSNALFSFEAQIDPNDNTIFIFQIRDWDTIQSNIPINLYPTLQYVQYDFANSTVTGNCTLPTSSSDLSGTSQSCMTGTFDIGDFIPLNITTDIPLNTTFAGTPVPTVKSTVRSAWKNWWYTDHAPVMWLKNVDTSTDTLTDTVLKTALTKPHDCTELKVCLAGTGGYPGSVVGAEVLVPMGMLLLTQTLHGSQCTSGGDGDNPFLDALGGIFDSFGEGEGGRGRKGI